MLGSFTQPHFTDGPLSIFKSREGGSTSKHKSKPMQHHLLNMRYILWYCLCVICFILIVRREQRWCLVTKHSRTTNLFEKRAKNVTYYIKHLNFRLSIANHSRLISSLFWSRHTETIGQIRGFLFF